MLSASKTAQELDISVATLTRWYEWYNNPEYPKPEKMPKLPAYRQDGVRSPRYWNKSDIKQLKKFQAWVPKGRGGVMGQFNKQFWGGR